MKNPERLMPWLLLLAACGGGAGTEPTPGARPPAAVPAAGVPVTVAAVTREAVPIRLTAIGTVEPPSSISVRSRVGGELLHVHFREGADVKKGEPLFDIDPRPYEAALAEAEAALERDRVRAKNLAQDVERYADLVAKDYVTREQYDRIRTDAAAAQATVAADQAAVDNARLDLDYCSIRSPITGRTGSVLVHEGNLVKANDDKPLLVILQMEPIDVRFAVPQQHLAEIRARAAAGALETSAEIPGSGAPVERGKLSFVDNAVDTATGTIALKATFANRDRNLWPGQIVRVTLDLSLEENAVVAPAQAIQTGQQGDYVFVVGPDRTVESRPVVVTRVAGNRAVIGEGLEAGETVVTDGQLRLAPGSLVAIKGETAGSPAEAGS